MEQTVQKSSTSTIISAILLVSGTCIGGGMLALPLATGLNGFLPSIIMMAVCWLAMTATALLLVEVTLWFGEGAHIITMSSHILGRYGKWLAAIMYLFICYASLVAYTAGGGSQLALGVNNYLGIEITKDWGAIIFAILFYSVIFLGTTITTRVNSTLVIAMLVAYFALVGFGIDEIKPELLKRVEWSGSFLAIPLLLTSFSFQTMVPSLIPYMKRNIRGLRWAIIGGTLLTFLVYVIWQAVILGIVPVHGNNGLAAALMIGEPATLFLQHHVQGSHVSLIGEYFAFFAIVTSFFGIAFGLFDFLADGLSLKKHGRDRFIISALIVLPILIMATQFERVFYIAMEVSGGFGDAILNGMIPVVMVWLGRYKFGYKSEVPMPFGKIMLVIIFAFYFAAFSIEVADRVGLYQRVTEAYDILKIQNPQEALQLD